MAAGKRDARPGSAGRVVELFAGVGGFRLGLEPSGWETVWANQWEPSTKTQHAADCYRESLRTGRLEQRRHQPRRRARWTDEGWDQFPDHDLLVGGFPCQDYSVAKVRSQAHGIVGKKGVLWWAINEIIENKQPRFVFLENVDRLLKSPTSQRGRDFAIILACLSDLGYLVEWRVVNAADYGFPSAAVVCSSSPTDVGDEPEPDWRGPSAWLYADGALARGLADRARRRTSSSTRQTSSSRATSRSSRDASASAIKLTPFLNAGVMWKRQVWTRSVRVDLRRTQASPRDVLQPSSEVPESFFVPNEQLERWTYLKGPKDIPRVAKNGHEYLYSEGGIAFPTRSISRRGRSSPARVVSPLHGSSMSSTPAMVDFAA